jgi:hypothetical protein
MKQAKTELSNGVMDDPIPGTSTRREMVPLKAIRIDGGTQSRAEIDEATVEAYTDAVTDGAELPDVGLVHDGTDYWLWDGFHRYHGFKRAGEDKIPAEVRDGTQRDAVLLACGANEAHGLRRTRRDKRKAVEILIRDAEWGKRSDRWISEACKVSPTFVGKTRADVSPPSTVNVDSSRQGQDGKSRKPPKPKAPAKPKSSKTVETELGEESEADLGLEPLDDDPEGLGHEIDTPEQAFEKELAHLVGKCDHIRPKLNERSQARFDADARLWLLVEPTRKAHADHCRKRIQEVAKRRGSAVFKGPFEDGLGYWLKRGGPLSWKLCHICKGPGLYPRPGSTSDGDMVSCEYCKGAGYVVHLVS